MNSFVITNVDVVLEHEILFGSVQVIDGMITEVSEGRSAVASAIDGAGDYLLAGLIEIHTDALEWHLRPRPQSIWPAAAAVAGHDAMLAASGITTVLDSLCIGDLGGDGFRSDILRKALDAITNAQMSGANRIDHKLHYRCEVADARTPGLFEDLVDNPLLTLVSLMDHTPGGRQYRDLDHYRNSTRPYRTDSGGIDVDIDTHIERLQARQAEHSMPNWERIAKMATDRQPR